MLCRGAQVHRHHRPQPGCRDLFVALGQHRPQATGHRRQDHVVDGSAEGRLDGLQLVQIGADDAVAAARGERGVQARARRRDDLVVHDDVGHRLGLQEGVAQAARVAGRVQPSTHGAGQQAERTGEVAIAGDSKTGAERRGLRDGSRRTCATSAAPTPSTSEWWVLVATAQRPPASPVTSRAFQSGRSRSSRSDQ